MMYVYVCVWLGGVSLVIYDLLGGLLLRWLLFIFGYGVILRSGETKRRPELGAVGRGYRHLGLPHN